MENPELVAVSKRLSRHLRHAPEAIGLTLSPDGWVEVDVLLAALERHGLRLTRAGLEEVVARNDKQRFAFDSTGMLIRASQGHSVDVDLGLPVSEPPAILFHGTVERFLPAILTEGLRPMKRREVHLSRTHETASHVGARRGKPIVLEIDAAAMSGAGHEFRVSENGVWLTAHVPPRFLRRVP
ncbi:RNA 2'-phosphotransferase [Amycolatopsis acidiphila]|uniref:Probable RNA 2'-phosphotransferase n=1 Tax=Amycolatopsis acidiphila TaxID=715473 RepID=A0A558A1W4_9PSEU|nr:RNA 2'-phosphotransferase [Amycolatopsis acidiphila]TVT18250.1 RNA 2'-phosphotransferase [Amycolatopsis acidiphila]UIJ64003.1 RNA 2'-phosphotransferase [Amycolatopsis acidiphila]GHG93402.1 putative RNA 2'-phosphotransferase [Amycolatopsis acidiphila]